VKGKAVTLSPVTNIFLIIAPSLLQLVYFITDRGLQESSIFTISSYLNECPRYLTVLLQATTDFNTDNTSDNTRHFIRSSNHFTFLSSVFPLNTPHTGSNTVYSVRTSARYTLLQNISTIHITTPAMRGKSYRNFYCYVPSTEDI
jgi:hypothetical protein